MTEDRLLTLITGQLAGELNPTETRELADWVNSSAVNRAWMERLSTEGYLDREIAIWRRIDPEMAFEQWLRKRRSQRSKVFRFRVSVAAACVLAILLTGLLWKKQTTVVKPVIGNIVKAAAIKPGRNTATLTLGNGQVVLLDSVGRGQVGVQGASKVMKVDKGSLAYQGSAGKVEVVVFNTLRTPRSGQYQVTLPDGTHVWLNNETSLTYPTAFRGLERKVELEGEAYFEVAQRAGQPFVVKVRDAEVKVLGTSFNVMSYVEEGGTQTTLLTGAVAVQAGVSRVRLLPDEQAQVSTSGTLTVVKDVPGEDIISWKDGFFYFGHCSFEAMMRQLARWYDIDVEYQGKAPEMDFAGRLDRNVPLDVLLSFLNKNQIHFRLEGRKLIVLPN